jgi:YjbE family integral membrane protein
MGGRQRVAARISAQRTFFVDFLAGLFTGPAISAFLQVIMIDLVLAGDNAIVIGLAAAGLPKDMRARAILIGIGAATVMRILFALITTQLLAITGLLLAGGLLLLWVCWKMYQELTVSHSEQQAAAEAVSGRDLNADGTVGSGAPRKTLGQAVIQIVIADVSMSLDNVLAVAGAAHAHPEILIFGLVLSVALMGVASSFIAALLNRHRWIAWVGLAVILYVALKMVYEGADDVLGHTLPAIPLIKGPMPIELPAFH